MSPETKSEAKIKSDRDSRFAMTEATVDSSQAGEPVADLNEIFKDGGDE